MISPLRDKPPAPVAGDDGAEARFADFGPEEAYRAVRKGDMETLDPVRPERAKPTLPREDPAQWRQGFVGFIGDIGRLE